VQKGALLTHRSILAVGQSAAVTHGLSWRDRVLAAAPLVYTGSGISVFMQLVVYPGATMVLLRDFDAELGLDAIVKHQVTACTMVPVIWDRHRARYGLRLARRRRVSTRNDAALKARGEHAAKHDQQYRRGQHEPSMSKEDGRVQRFDVRIAAGPRGHALIVVPFDPDAEPPESWSQIGLLAITGRSATSG